MEESLCCSLMLNAETETFQGWNNTPREMQVIQGHCVFARLCGYSAMWVIVVMCVREGLYVAARMDELALSK